MGRKKKSEIKAKRITKKILVVFTVFLFLFTYIFIEPYLLKITEYEIYDENIPAEFDGYEIVFAADIHHGPFFSYERVVAITKKINEIEADIILLGGDYVHRGPAYITPVFEALKGLSARYGVYGVLGNHDHWDGEMATRQGFSDAGIIELDNKLIYIEKNGSRIIIAGVGDYMEGTQEFNKVSDVYTILVSHNPDYIVELNEEKPNLMLSGHTHGGQITLFGLWAPLIPSEYGNRFRYGEMVYDGIRLIVTSGVGVITPPVRFFARPEIVKITLRSGEKQ